MADDDVLGMLDGPKSLYYAPAFSKALQATMAEYHEISNPVKQQTQVQILNNLHGHCADTYRRVLERNLQKNQRKRKTNDGAPSMTL